MSSSRLFVAVLAVVTTAVTGCPRSEGGDCDYDRECAPDICARDHQCAALSDVREVMVTWTVNGAPASATSCAPQPDMTLTFLGDTFGDEVGFSPVPCSIGQFFVDHLPLRFHSVDIGLGGRRISIEADGTAHGDYRP